MATGVQLSQLVRELRAEAGHSLNPAHGLATEDHMKYALARTEEELWISYDWRGRIINRDLNLTGGQRYYDYPADLPFDMVNMCFTYNFQVYTPLEFGIYPTDYNAYDSRRDVQSWPVRKWDNHLDEATGQNKMEFWPIPNSDGIIVVRGQKDLTLMVNDSDTCTLDGTLIVLFTAVEFLQRVNSEQAGLKMEKAQRHLQRIRGQQFSQKNLPIRLTPRRGPAQLRAGLDYIPSRDFGRN